MNGHLDHADPRVVSGWAWNAGTPDAPVEVDILVNGGVVTTVTADRFRADLPAAGIGDGHHAFDAPLPQSALRPGANTIEVRIAGGGPVLNGAPTTVENERYVEYFAGDIVDNCNLRCPFCLVDYTNIRTTNRMDEETFAKWVQIMPIVQDGQFYISCLHEATLHPRLYDFLEMIPADLGRKVFFTSNLCKPIKDADLDRLAASGIHHLNVSMDTLDDDLFGVLRKGGRLKIFKDNLERLVAAFKARTDAPELRYITMAYKTNVNEIPEMIDRAFEELGAGRHEIRYTYNVRHITEDFRREHFLAREDWQPLKDAVAARSDRAIDLVLPPDDYEEAFVRSTNYWVMPDEAGFPPAVPERPIALRGAWDGTVRVRKREEHFSVNVKMLEDPAAFFQAI